jgi:5-methyltetrahydropteroyltriglutamate--homocysteine methyltransferase
MVRHQLPLPGAGIHAGPLSLASERLFDEVAEAQALGHAVKATLIGPLTFLWLGKAKASGFERLALLEQLLPVYSQVLDRLKAQGVQWVQIDEPILGLDLPARGATPSKTPTGS